MLHYFAWCLQERWIHLCRISSPLTSHTHAQQLAASMISCAGFRLSDLLTFDGVSIRFQPLLDDMAHHEGMLWAKWIVRRWTEKLAHRPYRRARPSVRDWMTPCRCSRDRTVWPAEGPEILSSNHRLDGFCNQALCTVLITRQNPLGFSTAFSSRSRAREMFAPHTHTRTVILRALCCTLPGLLGWWPVYSAYRVDRLTINWCWPNNNLNRLMYDIHIQRMRQSQQSWWLSSMPSSWKAVRSIPRVLKNWIDRQLPC